jgi:hypothetical protein
MLLFVLQKRPRRHFCISAFSLILGRTSVFFIHSFWDISKASEERMGAWQQDDETEGLPKADKVFLQQHKTRYI